MLTVLRSGYLFKIYISLTPTSYLIFLFPLVQLQNEYEDNERPSTQGRATGTSIIPQEPQAVVQGETVTLISSYQPQALITTGIVWVPEIKAI